MYNQICGQFSSGALQASLKGCPNVNYFICNEILWMCEWKQKWNLLCFI